MNGNESPKGLIIPCDTCGKILEETGSVKIVPTANPRLFEKFHYCRGCELVKRPECQCVTPPSILCPVHRAQADKLLTATEAHAIYEKTANNIVDKFDAMKRVIQVAREVVHGDMSNYDLENALKQLDTLKWEAT